MAKAGVARDVSLKSDSKPWVPWMHFRTSETIICNARACARNCQTFAAFNRIPVAEKPRV